MNVYIISIESAPGMKINCIKLMLQYYKTLLKTVQIIRKLLYYIN